LALSITHGRYLSAKLDAKTQVIESMKLVAQNYQYRSEQTAKETSDAFTTLVEQIKGQDTALNAARAKFGSCNVAGGITAHRLPNVSSSAGQADVPEGAGGLPQPELIPVDRAFIDGCAGDSAFVRATHEWRIANGLPVQ
jgi:hypothetical protein